MDNHDIWKLASPYDEPETSHCEECDCENATSALTGFLVHGTTLNVCNKCYDRLADEEERNGKEE